MADAVLQESGVKGGLVVVLGCEDPGLLLGLHVNERFVVQGLDDDEATIAGARQRVCSAGLYGHVSVVSPLLFYLHEAAAWCDEIEVRPLVDCSRRWKL